MYIIYKGAQISEDPTLKKLYEISVHQRSNLAQKIFRFHAWVKKWHFGIFSERAGMAVPC